MFKPQSKNMKDDIGDLLRDDMLARTTKRYVGYFDTSRGTPTYHEWDDHNDALAWLTWAVQTSAWMNPKLVDRKGTEYRAQYQRPHSAMLGELHPSGFVLPLARCKRNLPPVH